MRGFALLLVIVALLLVACGSSETGEPASEAESPAETAVEVTRVVETEGTPETVIIEVPEEEPVEEEPVEEEPVEEEPVPTPPPTLPTRPPADRLVAEERLVELEWPESIPLGASRTIRLSLVPSGEGYVVVQDFEDNTTATTPLTIEPRAGYTLLGEAELAGVGFEISPAGPREEVVVAAQPVSWRWAVRPTARGSHALSVSLALVWRPDPGTDGPTRRAQIYSRALQIEARSIMGLTAMQATLTGILGLLFGGTLALPLALMLVRPQARPLQRRRRANERLVIEVEPTIALRPDDERLLRALFAEYARLVVEAEFRSGYSGARIYLVRPIRDDGRADAYTIAKIGERRDIEREHENYESFVKHTLPPITARIQDLPVVLDQGDQEDDEAIARTLGALRYTFIGEQGRLPVSLRQALLDDPDPARLRRLFETFGPNWWLQRRPYRFRLAQEYDRRLPAHYELEPVSLEGGAPLSGDQPPAATRHEVGDLVRLERVIAAGRHPERGYLSLRGDSLPGHPPLRLRLRLPPGHPLYDRARIQSLPVRVTATRMSMLQDYVDGMARFDLPDPLEQLEARLGEPVDGTMSPIHGDLNLENALVGPLGYLWLIDFAMTREGHTLADFAHLAAEIVSHVIAPRVATPAEFHGLLVDEGGGPLLREITRIAGQCLFNPAVPREFDLALYVTCLGALKYRNLERSQRELLYLTAAWSAQRL